MNKNLVCTGVLLTSLVAAGCQETERRQAPVAEQVAVSPTFTTMTLSAGQLMSLDWGGRTAGRSTIVDKRVAGTSVEFDIRFPGNGVGICSVDYVSTGATGQGALAGLDVSEYEALALKFTLVSVNGHNDPNLPLELAAGAIIGPAGDGRLSACESVVLGLSPERATKVATTPMHTQRIRVIGIHAHVVNPKAWDVNGGVVTLRVEPAAEAQVLASPVASPDRRSHGETPKAAPRKPQSEAANAPNSQPHLDVAQTPEPEPRTKSPSAPVFGTKRIGAW